MIEIFVNDQNQQLRQGATLAELIAQCATSPSTVAAINGTFVPRSRHADHPLQNGDRVELLAPMEGG
ncbi:MAG: sulfur carrier protein ThiS [Porticoccaceae bacterium]|nr:sulfur carrier protein ThiS [Porticoccaceae bacterium]